MHPRPLPNPRRRECNESNHLQVEIVHGYCAINAQHYYPYEKTYDPGFHEQREHVVVGLFLRCLLVQLRNLTDTISY